MDGALMLALTRYEPGGGPNSAAQSHTDMLRGKDVLSHFIHACYMCLIGFAYVHVLRRCTTLGRMSQHTHASASGGAHLGRTALITSLRVGAVSEVEPHANASPPGRRRGGGRR